MQTRRKRMLTPLQFRGKRAGAFSPGESAPADRALVSVELPESELIQCGCLYRGPCIFRDRRYQGQVLLSLLLVLAHLAPASLPSLFTVNAVLTIEISRCK